MLQSRASSSSSSSSSFSSSSSSYATDNEKSSTYSYELHQLFHGLRKREDSGIDLNGISENEGVYTSNFNISSYHGLQKKLIDPLSLIQSVDIGLNVSWGYQEYGSLWKHRSLSDFLSSLSLVPLPSLTRLSLSGGQIQVGDLQLFLSIHGQYLKSLDLTQTNIKTRHILAIPELKNLEILNLSGTIKLRRIDIQAIEHLLQRCPNLKQFIAHDCPDLEYDIKELSCRPDLQVMWTRQPDENVEHYKIALAA